MTLAQKYFGNNSSTIKKYIEGREYSIEELESITNEMRRVRTAKFKKPPEDTKKDFREVDRLICSSEARFINRFL